MYKAGEVAHCDKIVRDVLGDQLELHISGILQIKESEKFAIQMKKGVAISTREIKAGGLWR